MIAGIISCFLLVLSLLAPAAARSQTVTPSRYDALLEALKKDPAAVDYTALRMAYADSPRYAPYKDDHNVRGDMYAALHAGMYADALADARSILKDDYVDVDAHVVAAEAYAGLKNSGRARYHGRIVKGLIGSILASGDGKSPQTAFVVISINEEDVVLADLHWRLRKQATIEVDGHEYDKMDVVDLKTKQPLTVYFNVDRPTGWLKKKLHK